MSFLIASRLSHTQTLFLFKLSSEFILNQVFFFVLIFFIVKLIILLVLRDLWNIVELLWVPSEARFRKSGVAELQPAGQVALQPDFVNMFLLEHGHIHPFTYILYCCLLATRVELTNWDRDCMACKTESIYYLVLNRKMYCFHALFGHLFYAFLLFVGCVQLGHIHSEGCLAFTDFP